MAPGITDLPPSPSPPVVKSMATKTVPASLNGHAGGEPGVEEGIHNHNLNLNSKNGESTTATRTSEEETPTTFKYTTTKNLRDAQRRVEYDFRSDTVTVPTEGVMQVCRRILPIDISISCA